MKFTLQEIYNLGQSLGKLLSQELPIKTAYKLLKFSKECSSELQTLEKARVKLVKQYAGEKEEGKEVQVSDKNKEIFSKEFNDLLQEEVSIKFKPQLYINDFGDIQISAADLISLDKLIKEND